MSFSKKYVVKKKIEKKVNGKKKYKSLKMSMSMSMSSSMSNQPLKKVEPNVEVNVLMEGLAEPLSKVSNVESNVEKVRLSKLDLEKLSKKYNFEVEEALRFLKEKKSKDLSPGLGKVVKSVYPMPFSGEKKEGYCNGLVKNHGLYTQCPKKVKEGYCKGCEDKPYGTIDDRLKVDLYEYKDPKGKSPKRYTEVLKKLKISKENVEEEAKRLNITIAPIHLEEVVEQVKRGRPKTEKKVKETTGKKGRPKKEKKSVEVNNSVEEEEDLFATLIAKAQPLKKVESNDEPLDEPLDQPLEKVEPNPNPEEDVIVDQPLEKVEPNEEAKDLTPLVVEKVEKVEKKAKKVDPVKEAEKQKKADEKAAKEAAKEIEKQKKAEEKAAKEAEKQKKAEEKAAKEAEKQKKTSKALAPPLPKVDTKVDEEADVVRKFEHEGKSYYKSKNTGVIYNMEQEVVGKWNAERNAIDFEEEEEEEEEYDD